MILSQIELWAMVGEERRALRSKMKVLNRADDQTTDSRNREEAPPVSPCPSLPAQGPPCLSTSITHRKQSNVLGTALRNLHCLPPKPFPSLSLRHTELFAWYLHGCCILPHPCLCLWSFLCQKCPFPLFPTCPFIHTFIPLVSP